MAIAHFQRLRKTLEGLFPERHLYVRSGGEMRGYVLSTNKQLACAAGVGAAALWMGVCTAAMLVNALAVSQTDQVVLKQKAYYERLNADRQARLNSAVAQLSATSGSLDDLAMSVEKRHAALAMLVSDFKGAPGAAQALSVSKPALADASPGGPLIEAKDPRALAAVLDVDEEFAARIHRAASDMSDMRSLSSAAQRLPFNRPTANPALSSSYGVRFDPFTHRPAFHSGLDFPGAFYTPIMATAPGVISFTGVRSGYGNTVEIDHGGGFKTRYAHLQGIAVRVGQRVVIGQRVGAMGSTGRSTGPHLHYEVWVNGRAQNPNRFLKAGEYVQQAG
jgi:murein DD-endopeptidase MepM/ murein hydrolase activator NlpD